MTINSFCCTAKLRKELGVSATGLDTSTTTAGLLGSWYADLVRIGPKKCVVFLHPATGYTLVALDRRRVEIKALEALFKSVFRQTFFKEGVSMEAVDSLLSDYDSTGVAKTNSRSVVGSLTEMGRFVSWEFDSAQEVTASREVALSIKLSRVPRNCAKEGYFPFDRMSSILESYFGESGAIFR